MRRRHVIISGFLSAWLWPHSWSFVPLHTGVPILPLETQSMSRRIRSFVSKSNKHETSADTAAYFDPNEFYSWQRDIARRTGELLHSYERGSWGIETFEKALKAMEACVQRPSRKSAINLERLLRRVVEEKIAGNRNIDSVDMQSMYNAAILCWAKSDEEGAAQRAEEILDKMQSSYEAGDLQLKPNIETFNSVLVGYSTSKGKGSPQQAMRVVQKLEDLRTTGKTDVLPNTESYSIILKAYAASGGPNAPLMVLKLIQRMEKIAREGYPAVRPDYKCHNVYLNAMLSSMIRDLKAGKKTALKAEKYLQQMLESDDEDSKPDAWSFNIVISTWSKSGDWEMTERAEALVSKLEEYHAVCGRSEKTEPNTNTYNCLIACYSRSTIRDKAQKAHAILNMMKGKCENDGLVKQRPDAVTFNSVMNAYAKSNEVEAPQKVEALLKEMYTLYEVSGDRHLKPSSRSFNTCLDAWAKSNQHQAADRIMDWIQHMQVNYDNGKSPIAPNKWTYNAYLEALSKVRRPSIGDEAEKVLKRMDEEFEKGRLHLKPDVLTFTNVIHCIALSGAEDVFERAYAILSKMEDLHASGYGDVRPNVYTYNCVINAVAKSKLHAKSKIALKMLQRMKHVALRPLTITYNNILNACAFSNPREENRKEVLDIAMSMLKEAQETSGANFITYGTCLRVIGTFEEDPVEIWRLTRETFRSCCSDGQLTVLVMKQIKFAVNPSQYSLLCREAEDPRNGRLREDFTRNARRIKTKPMKKKVISS